MFRGDTAEFDAVCQLPPTASTTLQQRLSPPTMLMPTTVFHSPVFAATPLADGAVVTGTANGGFPVGVTALARSNSSSGTTSLESRSVRCECRARDGVCYIPSYDDDGEEECRTPSMGPCRSTCNSACSRSAAAAAAAAAARLMMVSSGEDGSGVHEQCAGDSSTTNRRSHFTPFILAAAEPMSVLGVQHSIPALPAVAAAPAPVLTGATVGCCSGSAGGAGTTLVNAPPSMMLPEPLNVSEVSCSSSVSAISLGGTLRATGYPLVEGIPTSASMSFASSPQQQQQQLVATPVVPSASSWGDLQRIELHAQQYHQQQQQQSSSYCQLAPPAVLQAVPSLVVLNTGEASVTGGGGDGVHALRSSSSTACASPGYDKGAAGAAALTTNGASTSSPYTFAPLSAASVFMKTSRELEIKSAMGSGTHVGQGQQQPLHINGLGVEEATMVLTTAMGTPGSIPARGGDPSEIGLDSERVPWSASLRLVDPFIRVSASSLDVMGDGEHMERPRSSGSASSSMTSAGPLHISQQLQLQQQQASLASPSAYVGPPLTSQLMFLPVEIQQQKQRFQRQQYSSTPLAMATVASNGSINTVEGEIMNASSGGGGGYAWGLSLPTLTTTRRMGRGGPLANECSASSIGSMKERNAATTLPTASTHAPAAVTRPQTVLFNGHLSPTPTVISVTPLTPPPPSSLSQSPCSSVVTAGVATTISSVTSSRSTHVATAAAGGAAAMPQVICATQSCVPCRAVPRGQEGDGCCICMEGAHESSSSENDSDSEDESVPLHGGGMHFAGEGEGARVESSAGDGHPSTGTAQGDECSNNNVTASRHKGVMEGSPLVRLRCGHCYHVNCLQRWLLQDTHCPICRRDVMSAPAPAAAVFSLS